MAQRHVAISFSSETEKIMTSISWFERLDPVDYIVCYPPARAGLALGLGLVPKANTVFHLNPVKLERFSDGELNILVPHLHKLPGKKVVYVADWSCPAARYADLCILLPIAEMLGNGMLTIVVPFFGTATMERESVEGSVATANVDAKLLSQLPGSHKRIIAIDLHTTQNQFFFHNCVVSLRSCMPTARKVLEEKLGKNLVFAFPDEGAKKRFAQYFADADVAVCAKVRDGDKRQVRLTDGNVAHRNVVIIDDLVRSGGTLIECAKALIAAGGMTISVFVPHACFPEGEYSRFISGADADLIENFFITDSISSTAAAIANTGSKKFHMIGIAAIIKSFFQE